MCDNLKLALGRFANLCAPSAIWCLSVTSGPSGGSNRVNTLPAASGRISRRVCVGGGGGGGLREFVGCAGVFEYICAGVSACVCVLNCLRACLLCV